MTDSKDMKSESLVLRAANRTATLHHEGSFGGDSIDMKKVLAANDEFRSLVSDSNVNEVQRAISLQFLNYDIPNETSIQKEYHAATEAFLDEMKIKVPAVTHAKWHQTYFSRRK